MHTHGIQYRSDVQRRVHTNINALIKQCESMHFAKREGAVNRKDLSTDPLLVIYFALAEFYLL